MAWQRQWRISHDVKEGAVDEIIWTVREQDWRGPAMKKAEIRLTFYLPDRRRRDGLMLLERMKPWLDGLVQGQQPVLVDDDLATIGFPVALWEYRKGSPGTLIEIKETA